MICEKCGKNNPSKNTICSSCKAPLPVCESCGGFADILTFNDVPGPVTVTETRTAGMNDADAKRLVAKTSAIAEYNKKITLFTLIGAGVSTLILILAIVFLIITSSKVSVLEHKISSLNKDNDSALAVEDNNPDNPDNTDNSDKSDVSEDSGNRDNSNPLSSNDKILKQKEQEQEVEQEDNQEEDQEEARKEEQAEDPKEEQKEDSLDNA